MCEEGGKGKRNKVSRKLTAMITFSAFPALALTQNRYKLRIQSGPNLDSAIL